MTALLLAVAILAALLSGPFWMHYERRRTIEDLERRAARRLRDLERQR